MNLDSPGPAPRPSRRRVWPRVLGGMVSPVLVAVTVGVGTFAYASTAAESDAGGQMEFRRSLTIPPLASGVSGPDLGTPTVTRHLDIAGSSRIGAGEPAMPHQPASG
ncbi:hypothetical protein [Rhodococcus jostii]|uniref:hypothetical protein n=1 Tax=Rhodococcus jostii TaxID=132919 RepID=UPI00362AAA9A